MAAPKPKPRAARTQPKAFPGFPMVPAGGTANRHGSGGRVFPGTPMVPVRGHGRHGRGRRGGGRAFPGFPMQTPGGRHGLATGGRLPLCTALAVAESLLAATGARAAEDDLLALHAAAGGDAEGALLGPVLATVAERGLAGYRPLAITPSPLADGTVVSVALELAQEAQPEWDAEPSPPWGLHAAYLTGGHVLSWGRAIPVTGAFLERQALAAWQITWG